MREVNKKLIHTHIDREKNNSQKNIDRGVITN